MDALEGGSGIRIEGAKGEAGTTVKLELEKYAFNIIVANK